MNVKRFLMLAAVVLLVVPAGCIFSPDQGKDTPPPPPELPKATTKKQLMDNFQTVYESMDYDGYLTVIDPSFRIYLTPETRTEFSLPNPYFDYEEEERIAKNMFSGDAITRPDGTVVPGIVSIQFNNFQPEDAWQMSPPDDPIPNAEWAPYRVDIVINQGSRLLRIQGTITFYVKAFDDNGVTIYRMVGQVDGTTPPA